VVGGVDGNLEHLDLRSVAAGADILIGGPPCQGFSRLGQARIDRLNPQRKGDDPRNALYRTFLHAVVLWTPRAVVMENVPGMLSARGMNVAAEAAGDIAALGYRVGYAVLNAVWFGVPQFRERLFLVGIHKYIGAKPAMPRPTHRAELPSGYLRPAQEDENLLPFCAPRLGVELDGAGLPATTVAEALDDLPVLTDHLSGGGLPRGDFRRALTYRCSPHSAYARLMRGWPGLPLPTVVVDHVVRRTPRDYDTFRRMSPGDRYPEAIAIARQRLREEVERLAGAGKMANAAEMTPRFIPPYPENIFIDKWRKLIPNQPSWTVPAHLSRDTYSHIHHDAGQARMISPREAARLQSFPDAFAFAGNMGDCFRQIGNAVPPLLAWAIAFSLLQSLGCEGVPPPTQIA